jgi:hypothetical protein
MIRNIVVLIPLVLYGCLSNTEILFAQPASQAQISGNVRDVETGLPLFYVNVFLANTTMGTTTNKDGDFIIRNIPAGEYQLVIHHIGYRMEIRSVDTFGRTDIEFEVSLTPIAIAGESVEIVAPDAEKWRKLLKIFNREFIGTSGNAEECEILNPEVLDLWIDPGTKHLMAATDSILHIVNHALGYRAQVVLLNFEYDYANGTVRFQMLPRYEDLVLADSLSSETWQQNRRRSVAGSLRHFLMAVSRDRIYQEGFTAMLVSETGSRDRLRLVDGEELTSMYESVMHIFFIGPLYVKYSRDESWIELRDGAVRIDTLGNCWGQHTAIIRYGDWAKERFADCLPFDYRLAMP